MASTEQETMMALSQGEFNYRTSNMTWISNVTTRQTLIHSLLLSRNGPGYPLYLFCDCGVLTKQWRNTSAAHSAECPCFKKKIKKSVSHLW